MNSLEPSKDAQASLEEFLKRVWPKVKVTFARQHIPIQDTEDILQQALLALLYQRDHIRDQEAWLLGTIRNKCRLYWREQRRRLYDTVDAAVLECMAEPIPPEQEVADRRRDLATAIGKLPEKCRTFLDLRYRHGYEPGEVAERLGYSPASIGKTSARCIAALTRQFTASGDTRKKGSG
jgi:RNA polymerase sigma factor (sigma-70 family)